MRIAVRRSGGYAGSQSVANVDTSRLDAVSAREIERLAGVAAESATGRAEPVGADLMRYEITIEDGAQKRSLTFTDDGSPEAGPIKRLIEAVGTAADR